MSESYYPDEGKFLEGKERERAFHFHPSKKNLKKTFPKQPSQKNLPVHKKGHPKKIS